MSQVNLIWSIMETGIHETYNPDLHEIYLHWQRTWPLVQSGLKTATQIVMDGERGVAKYIRTWLFRLEEGLTQAHRAAGAHLQMAARAHIMGCQTQDMLLLAQVANKHQSGLPKLIIKVISRAGPRSVMVNL